MKNSRRLRSKMKISRLCALNCLQVLRAFSTWSTIGTKMWMSVRKRTLTTGCTTCKSRLSCSPRKSCLFTTSNPWIASSSRSSSIEENSPAKSIYWPNYPRSSKRCYQAALKTLPSISRAPRIPLRISIWPGKQLTWYIGIQSKRKLSELLRRRKKSKRYIMKMPGMMKIRKSNRLMTT